MAEAEHMDLSPFELEVQHALKVNSSSKSACPDTMELCDWIEQGNVYENADFVQRHLFDCSDCSKEFLRLQALWRETLEAPPLKLPVLPKQETDNSVEPIRQTAPSRIEVKPSLLARIKKLLTIPALASATAFATLAVIFIYRLSDAEKRVEVMEQRASKASAALAKSESNPDRIPRSQLEQVEKESAMKVAAAERDKAILMLRYKQSQNALDIERKKIVAQATDQRHRPSVDQMAALIYSHGTTASSSTDESGVVAILSPLRGAILSSHQPVLRWKAVPNADSYRISLLLIEASNPDDSRKPVPVADRQVASSESSWKVDPRLTSGRVYEWNVTAWRKGNLLASSDFVRFFIE